ncbi:putative 3-hydroxyphenylpropionic transporter MhpT [Sphingomonas mucosissima]|uniref:Putative 3-hydroxyphenylpropionic transporter MhpT n=2 Tax=Sphingomonas mucosissima TaxID=370959 RepID=A0A245ZFH5_9SPHN|nr:putative 3-hydroxyphenylpropionic transporter MhpT [Sphingomonas mucosissima]
MIGIGTGPGLFQNLSSLFIVGPIAEFGWSRGDIATAAGLGLLGGLAAPFLGRLADRIGARAIILLAMILLGLVYAGMASLSGPLWQYQLLIFGLALTVPGTSAIVYGKLISQRFHAHRGIALGVATSGISLSSLALAPVVGMVIAAYGWRVGFLALGFVVSALALPAVLLLLRGEPIPTTRPNPHAPSPVVIEGMTGAETRRDSRYWRLALTAALINIASVGLVTSLVPFGMDRGFDTAEAALLVTSFAASQVVGRLVMGALVDRFRPQLTAAAFATASALAFVVLQVPAPGLPLLVAAVFFAGLMNGAEHDLLPFLAARLFGLRAYGEVYGLLVMISLFGTATGITAFGRLHDATGNYSAALTMAAVALVGAAVLFLTLRERPLPLVQVSAHPA